MFEKRKNKLSIILYKYKDIVDYRSIKDDKLRYCVFAQLRGKLHMKKLFLDNAPLYFRVHKKLKPIHGFLREWTLENQEEFIQQSEWFKQEVFPLVVYDIIKEVNDMGIFDKTLYAPLFQDDKSLTEFDLGQIYFTQFAERDCVSKILVFIFSYYGAVSLDKIFELVNKYYPVKYDKTELKRKVVLQLYKWRRKGYLFNQNLKFSGKKKFFVDAIGGKI